LFQCLMPFFLKNLLICGALAFVLTACRNEKIETYLIPKEAPMTMPAPDLGGPSAESKEIEWTVPAGWSEQAPSAMRLGSFLIKGENKQTADMSVIPLSGEAGGDLANINRWRGQIALRPLSALDLSSQSELITPAGRRMRYIDFANQGRRLIAAIYHRGERTWFFKITGESTTVLSAKPAFIKFLKSLQFHENS